jgi:CTP:molybdopterin cytidylyltransferase MocA
VHPLGGRPLVHWPIHAAREAGAGRVVVVDSAARPLDGHLPDDVVLAVQEQPNGTADALEAAAGAFPDDGAVVVLSGDVPLVTADFVADLVATHAASDAAATMATMVLDEPGEYGRVLRDAAGRVVGVVEAKGAGDATAEQLAIREVNTGHGRRRRVDGGRLGLTEDVPEGPRGRPRAAAERRGLRDPVVESSPHRWEHRRVTLPARAAQRRRGRDGFAAVGTWFPLRYYTRELDAPASGDG